MRTLLRGCEESFPLLRSGRGAEISSSEEKLCGVVDLFSIQDKKEYLVVSVIKDKKIKNNIWWSLIKR